jgi:DNA-binding NarL/FixJ family response regulator
MTTLNAVVHVLLPYRAKRDKVHASAPRALTSAEAEHALRLAAKAADVRATTELSLASLWRDLARGHYGVVHGFFCEERCYLVLSTPNDDDALPIEGRRLEILELVLSGMRQKNIAIDLRLAPSTVALNSKLALEGLGVAGKPSRAHPLLMLAARAASEPVVHRATAASFVSHDGRQLCVIGVSRPDRALDRVLPSAELAVIRSLVEGLAYEEIAQRRGTSTRTIANQISAVFRRLRVSGRNELVQRLFFDETLGKPSSRPAARTLAPRARDPKQPTPLGGARRSA